MGQVWHAEFGGFQTHTCGREGARRDKLENCEGGSLLFPGTLSSKS